MPKEYNDAILRVWLEARDDVLSVELTLPSGGRLSHLSARPGLDPTHRDELRWLLEVYPTLPAREDEFRVAEVRRRLATLGEALYAALFAPQGVDPRIMAQPLPRATIAITSASESLLELPWELLRDAKGYLYERGISVVRISSPTATDGAHAEISILPRLLLVVARPVKASDSFIDPFATLCAILTHGSGAFAVEVLAPATAHSLRRRLRDAALPGVGIVHFDAHGAWEADTETGYVNLEDEHGGVDSVNAMELASLLQTSGRPPLIVLETCDSARPQGAGPIANIACALSRNGFSVLAMQYAVLPETSERFVAAFYDSLRCGEPVGVAVDKARTALSIATGSVDSVHCEHWFVPVLYANSMPAAQARLSHTGERSDSLTLGDRREDAWTVGRELTRRSVILTGMSGSGHDDVAESALQWMSLTCPSPEIRRVALRCRSDLEPVLAVASTPCAGHPHPTGSDLLPRVIYRIEVDAVLSVDEVLSWLEVDLDTSVRLLVIAQTGVWVEHHDFCVHRLGEVGYHDAQRIARRILGLNPPLDILLLTSRHFATLKRRLVMFRGQTYEAAAARFTDELTRTESVELWTDLAAETYAGLTRLAAAAPELAGLGILGGHALLGVLRDAMAAETLDDVIAQLQALGLAEDVLPPGDLSHDEIAASVLQLSRTNRLQHTLQDVEAMLSARPEVLRSVSGRVVAFHPAVSHAFRVAHGVRLDETRWSRVLSTTCRVWSALVRERDLGDSRQTAIPLAFFDLLPGLLLLDHFAMSVSGGTRNASVRALYMRVLDVFGLTAEGTRLAHKTLDWVGSHLANESFDTTLSEHDVDLVICVVDWSIHAGDAQLALGVLSVAERALEQATMGEDERAVMREDAIYRRASLYASVGRKTDAIALLQGVRDRLLRLGLPGLEGRIAAAHGLLGLLESHRGRDAAAQEEIEKGHDLGIDIGERARGVLLHQAGCIEFRSGRLEEGRKLLRDAHSYFVTADDSMGCAQCLRELASSVPGPGESVSSEQLDEAEARAREARLLFRQLGCLGDAALCAYELGRLADLRERTPEALRWFRTARSEALRTGHWEDVARCYVEEGHALLRAYARAGRPTDGEFVELHQLVAHAQSAVEAGGEGQAWRVAELRAMLSLSEGDVDHATDELWSAALKFHEHTSGGSLRPGDGRVVEAIVGQVLHPRPGHGMPAMTRVAGSEDASFSSGSEGSEGETAADEEDGARELARALARVLSGTLNLGDFGTDVWVRERVLAISVFRRLIKLAQDTSPQPRKSRFDRDRAS